MDNEPVTISYVVEITYANSALAAANSDSMVNELHEMIAEEDWVCFSHDDVKVTKAIQVKTALEFELQNNESPEVLSL